METAFITELKELLVELKENDRADILELIIAMNASGSIAGPLE